MFQKLWNENIGVITKVIIILLWTSNLQYKTEVSWSKCVVYFNIAKRRPLKIGFINGKTWRRFLCKFSMESKKLNINIITLWRKMLINIDWKINPITTLVAFVLEIEGELNKQIIVFNYVENMNTIYKDLI